MICSTPASTGALENRFCFAGIFLGLNMRVAIDQRIVCGTMANHLCFGRQFDAREENRRTINLIAWRKTLAPKGAISWISFLESEELRSSSAVSGMNGASNRES